MARPSRPPAAPAPAAPAPARPGGLHLAGCWLLAAAATLLVYWPALRGGFLWDDDGHVTRLDLRSLAGLARIWFEPGATQQYYPLLHSAFWLQHRAWGEAPLGYHLATILLHATAAVLFAAVLRRLAVPGAALAAGLFLLHPVNVESVAWISEQKNTLSLVLYLAAALAYLRFDRERRPADYAWATGCFLLALLTKTVTATLPAALLVVCWWRRGRLEWRRDVRPLLPWWVLGAAAGLFTAHFEATLIGAHGADFALGPLERGLLAGRVFWFYLGKLGWPAGLTFIYPRWHVDAGVPWQWLFPLAGLGLLAGLFLWRRRSRAPLAAALLFGGSLFPVLGFFNVYPFRFSYVADHFQYLASLGVFALVGSGLASVLAGWPRLTARAVVGALLLGLAGLSWRQAADYRDDLSLFEATLRRNPGAWMAHINLAKALAERGRHAEAVRHLERALVLRPDEPEAWSNLGDDLTRLGRPAEALAPLERALRLQPDFPEAHNNLGVALMALERAEEGRAQFAAAVRLRPSYAVAQRNLGLALATAGRIAEALPHFARAARLDPRDAEAEFKWGTALLFSDRFAEAAPHFERALRLAPGVFAYHALYARALLEHGRLDEAIARYRDAVALAPDSSEAHRELALALRRRGRPAEAAEHDAEAQRLRARRMP